MPIQVPPRRALMVALSGVLALGGLIAVAPSAQAAPPGYADAVLADNPAAYYRLGDASLATMADSSPAANDGAYVGAVTLSKPPAITVDTDTSVTFNGGQFGLAMGVAAPTTAYTLEAWVRPDNAGMATLVELQGAGDLFRNGDVLGFVQTVGPPVVSPPGTLTMGAWSHVAATWDGTDTRLYVNGVEVAHSDSANTPPSFTTGYLTIGAGTHTAFTGGIDEVAYYEHAVSAADIEDHYAIGADTTPPVITFTAPAPRGQYILHDVPPPAYSCADEPGGSGIRDCVATPFHQSLGPHDFTVTAIDRAGNERTTTISYTVVPNRYRDEVLRSSPIAYYRLNDPIGATTMTDHSGHHRDGIYKNAVAQRKPAAIACERRPNQPRVCKPANDPEDFATHFGGGGYGYLNGLAAPQHAYTLEAWIKRDNHADGSIVGQGGAGQLYITNGRLALRQTQDNVVSAGPVLTPGAWYHVAATWNGSTTRLYVNGVEVATSHSANKPPSGIATVYVGNGEMAPPFQGDLDEVAYYATALSGHVLKEHYDVGTAYDWPSLVLEPPADRNTGLPAGVISTPAVDALYAPTKLPHATFHCTDPDGHFDIVECTATVDGHPIAHGALLPNGLGPHTFTITARDTGGNVDTHSVVYTVKSFADIFRTDFPVAYYRLNDTGSVMADSSGNHRNGEYKNWQQSGPVGISGDGDTARRFFGDGGYGYSNAVSASPFQATLEAWVYPEDHRDQSIAGLAGSDELYIAGGRFVYRHLDRIVTASVGPTPHTWTQVVGVWDGDTVRIYVDGTLRGTASAATGTSYGAGTFYVGYGMGVQKPWFFGSIDEVVYYDRALSPERVYQHWLADPPPDSLSAPDTPATPPVSAPTPTVQQPTGPTAQPTAGAKTCRVPKVRGLKVATARAKVAKAGCRLVVVKYREVGKRKHGRVLVQRVAAGSSVTQGRAIRVVVGR